MSEKKNTNWNSVLIEVLFIAMLLFGLLAVGFAYKSNLLEDEIGNGFNCLNAIKIDCNTVGSYPCGQLNEPCCRFYEPRDVAEKGNCAFCTNWEFK